MAPGGGYDAQLRAGVIWDIESTNAYITEVEAKIASLGATATSTHNAGELISGLETEVKRISAVIRESLAAAVAEGLDIGTLSTRFEGLIGNITKPLRPQYPGATSTRLLGSGAGDRANLAELNEGFTNAQAREALAEEQLLHAKQIKAQQAIVEELQGNATILNDQLTSATEALGYQQFFADALKQQNGQAVALIEAQAQSILLTEERNAALKTEVGEERLQQYLMLKSIIPGTNAEAFFKPQLDALKASETTQRVAVAQKTAGKSVEAEDSVNAEQAAEQRAATEEYNASLRQRAAEAQAFLERQAETQERADAEEAGLREEYNASLQRRAADAQAFLERSSATQERADAKEAALREEYNAALQRRAADAQAFLERELATQERAIAEEAAVREEYNAVLRQRAAEAQAFLERSLATQGTADAEEAAEREAYNAVLRKRAADAQAFLERELETQQRAIDEEAAIREEYNATLRQRAADAQGFLERTESTQEVADAEELAARQAYVTILQERAANAQGFFDAALSREIATEERADAEEAAIREEYNAALRQRAAQAQAFTERQLATQARAAEEEAAIAPRTTTGFQRFQANLSGGDAEDKKTLGDLLGGGTLGRTVKYAASGALLFGGLSLGRNIFNEAEKLQVAMAQIKATMEETGTSGTDAFNKVSDSIIRVSINTATSADQVADLTRRLAGVFASPQGVPDFSAGLEQTQTALKLATVTGLPKDEITNDLVAISKSFDDSFTHIGDTAIGLARDFGGSAADIIKFTGALAPVGKDLGFTSDQLAGFGAVVQEFSGQSASTLTAEFTRILPAIQSSRDKIVELFNGNGGLQTQLAQAFAQNDIRGVIVQLVGHFDELSNAQKNDLASILGLRRGADSMFAAFEHGDATLKALGVTGDQYAGLLGSRFGEVQNTMSFQFSKLGDEVNAFGVALLNSGIASGFGDIASSLGLVVGAAAKVVDFFSFLNESLGGIPGQLVGIALGLAAIAKAMQVLNAARTANILGGVLGGGSKAAAVAGTGEVEQLAFPGLALGASTAAPGIFGKLLKGGGALTEGAEAGFAAGGFSAGIAGIATIAAPVLAVWSLAKLNETVDQTGKAIGSAKDNLQQVTLDQLKAGVSPEEIRRRLASAGNTDFTFAQTAVSFITGQGTDGPSDVVNQTIKDFFANKDKDKLEAEAKAAIAYLSDPGHLKKSSPSLRGLKDDDPAVKEAKQANTELISSIQDKLKAFDADPGANIGDLTSLINLDEPDFSDIIKTIGQQQDDKAAVLQKAADGQKSLPALADSINTAKAQYEAGQGSLDPLLAAQDRQSALIQTFIDADHVAGQDDSKDVKAFLDNRKQQSDEIAAAAQQDQQNATAIAGFLGQDTQQFKTDQAQKRLTTLLNDPRVLPSARVSAALDLATQERKQQEDAISRSLNQFGLPLDAIQKADALRKGFTISPEAQRALDTAAVLSTSNQDLLEPIAPNLYKTLDGLTNNVVDQMVQTGQDAKSIIIRMLEDRKKILIQQAKMDRLTGDKDAAAHDVAAIHQIDAAEAAAQGIDAGDIGTHGSASADDQANADAAAAQEKRQNAQAEANARLDIQAAKSKGNALALAQIAQQRAQIDFQFAGSTADQLAAQAKMIEADQAVNQANLDHNKALRDLFVAQSGDDAIKAAQEAIDNALDIINSPASGPDDVLKAQSDLARGEKQRTAAQVARNKGLRDLAVAQSGDDPIKAAQEAIDNANEAAASASNPDEWISAQAALLRAQKTMAEAVRAGIDGQFDLLIAVDNFNGDAVKAAKDTLSKLQARLNDPNLKLSDADRAQLQAQIQNQELQVSQTQISQGEQDINNALELGNISKAQAIAQLGALKQFAVNQREITEIDLEIKRLKDQLGQDYKFNLPTVLGLPTLYEARRTSQDPTLTGSTGYNDNRTITITVVAQTNADPNQIAAAVQSVMGPPQTYGVSGRRY